MTSRKGFTLIELLVVVLIIGILSAVAVPQYQKAVDKSRLAELYASARHMAQTQQVYYLANNVWESDVNELDLGYLLVDCSTNVCVAEDAHDTQIEWSTSGAWTVGMFLSSNVAVGLYGWNGKIRQCIASGIRAENICKSLTGKTEPTSAGENTYYKVYAF